MNFQVDWEASNITSIVIDYQRMIDICTSIGTININVVMDSKAYKTFDTIELYEEGIKKGTFYISEISKGVTDDITILSCQDSSKYLVDYFVIEQYELDYLSSSRFWIEKFLTESGVAYNFNTVSQGNTMSQNSAFGLSSAYDIIIPILQQNGWYMYADANGTMQIGEFVLDTNSVDASLDDTKIISIMENLGDSQLRNRAVVWGSTDPLTNDWIYADVSVGTDWQIDSNDIRTVVLGDSNIRSTPAAYDVANRILNAFQLSVVVKTIEVVGAVDLYVGDTVYVNSKYSQGYGVATQVQSQGSSSGLTTTIVLDKKCPRLFSYFSYDGTIYAGTWGDGIYKKGIDGDTTWSSFNSGLGNLYIRDLAIFNSVLICVADDGYAYKRRITEDSSWSKISHGDFIDEFAPRTYVEGETRAIACSISRTDNIVYIAINSIADAVSWILTLNPDYTIGTKTQVIKSTSNKHDYIIEDIDTANNKLILTAATQASGSEVTLWVDFGGNISKKTAPAYISDETSLTFGPKSGNDYNGYESSSGLGKFSGPIVIDNDIHLITSTTFGIFPDGSGATLYTLPSPAPLSGDELGGAGIVKESDDKFHFVTYSDSLDIIYHYSYIISTDTLTLEKTITFSDDSDYIDGKSMIMVNNEFYYNYSYDDGSIRGWKIKSYTPITQVSTTYTFGTSSTGSLVSSSKLGATNDSVAMFTARINTSGIDWEMFGGFAKVVLITHEGSYTETSLEAGTADAHAFGSITLTTQGASYWASNVALNACFGIVSFGIRERYSGTPDHFKSRAWVLNTGGGSQLVHNINIHDDDTYNNDDGYGGLTESFPGFSSWGVSTSRLHPMSSRAQNPIAIVKTSEDNFYIEDLLAFTKVVYNPFDTPEFQGIASTLKGVSAQIDDFDNTFYYIYQDGGINYLEGISPLLGTAIKTSTLPDTDSMTSKTTLVVIQGKVISFRGALVHVYEADISHIPNELGEGMVHKVLSNQGTIFQSLDSVPTESRVEISKYSPTLIHSVPSGIVLILPTGAGWEYSRGTDFLARSYTNLSGSWSGFFGRKIDTPLNPLGPILDARIYDIYKNGTSIFTPASGVVDTDSNLRYIGYSDGTRGFAAISATISGSQFYIYTPSGLPSMIETTNYTYPQTAIFLSISGNPSLFFQKKAEEFIFNEQSTGLPNSNITILKVDDRI